MLSDIVDLENVALSTLADDVSWAIMSLRKDMEGDYEEEIEIGIKLCKHLRKAVLIPEEEKQNIHQNELYSTVSQLTFASTSVPYRKDILSKMMEDSKDVEEKLQLLMKDPDKDPDQVSDTELKSLERYFAELTGNLIA